MSERDDDWLLVAQCETAWGPGVFRKDCRRPALRQEIEDARAENKHRPGTPEYEEVEARLYERCFTLLDGSLVAEDDFLAAKARLARESHE